MAPNAGYAYRSRAERGGLSVLAYLAASFRHSGADEWAQRLPDEAEESSIHGDLLRTLDASLEQRVVATHGKSNENTVGHASNNSLHHLPHGNFGVPVSVLAP